MSRMHTIALAICVSLPAPALAQLDGRVSPTERSTPIPSPDAGTERIAVIGADDLAGRSLVASDGDPAGRIAHVLIDPASGAIRAALVDSVPGLSLDGEGLVVPWSRLTPSPAGRAMGLAMTGSELAAAPRFRDLRFAAGARPEVTAQIFDFTTGSAAPSPVDTTDPPPPKDFLVLPSGPRTTDTAGPPVLVSARELHGVSVTDQDGQALGEIERVMIDLEHGHAAYLLVAEGGVAAPRAWLPVPIEVLVPSGKGYALGVETFWLRQVPPLSSPNPPGTVGSAWLRGLYVNYGIDPYWR
jgi:sporulation protein YlmC with PRC-barrel domain